MYTILRKRILLVPIPHIILLCSIGSSMINSFNTYKYTVVCEVWIAYLPADEWENITHMEDYKELSKVLPTSLKFRTTFTPLKGV